MIETLFNRFQRWLPRPGDDLMPHAWTNEDSNWHVSSLELARGLEVVEVCDPLSGVGDFPRLPAVFHDTLPAVHDPRR